MTAAMKWAFFLLLLGNIALAVGMLVPMDKGGAESMTRHAPYHAEKIRLMAEEEIPPPALAPPIQICLEWSPLARQNLDRAKTALAPLQLDENDLTVRDAPEKATTHWVYIPPLKSMQEAQKKVEELKSLGVDDSFVMQDSNKWRHAISLGIFSTEDAASNYLKKLREKGINSAKAGPRNPEGGYASLLIRSTGENIEAELIKIKQEFPGTQLTAVPCAQ